MSFHLTQVITTDAVPYWSASRDLAPAHSKLVERNCGLLEGCVRDGRATHVPARRPAVESNDDKLKRAMHSTARIFGVFDHVAEQQALFDSVCKSSTKPVTVAGRDSHEEAWHALGGSPGLFF